VAYEKKFTEEFVRKMKMRYFVWRAIRDGSWWEERKKIDERKQQQQEN
jgi:hypothetical protein